MPVRLQSRMEEAPAQGKKRKVSRKTHLRELAEAKKKKKGVGSSSIPASAEDADPDYVVGDGACLNEDEVDEEMDVDVEAVGAATKREDAKQRQRLHRVRGLSCAGRVMHGNMVEHIQCSSRGKACRVGARGCG